MPSLDPVPGQTIRSVWDSYDQRNFAGTNVNEKYGIGTLLGIPFLDRHTTRKCGNRLCTKKISEGKMKSARVPIGGQAYMYDGKCDTGDLTNTFVYGEGNYSGLGKKLNDDTATNCAGGSSLMYTKFLNRDSVYKYNNSVGIQTQQCYFGAPTLNDEIQENCVVAGVHWPTFCQMGDYVSTNSTCKANCSNVRSTDPNKETYCHWAFDRLCGKTINDNIKMNNVGAPLKSDRNWISDSVCQGYCGGPNQTGSRECEDYKQKYCNNKSNWPFAAEYCYDYFQTRQNRPDMIAACQSKLTSASNPENITTGKGCGYLCRGTGLNVNEEFCRDMNQAFCTATPENMETLHCFNYCKNNPAQCEKYLAGTYCKDKGDKLDLPVPSNNGKLYGDYCGCMMGTPFYEDFKNKVFGQYRDAGYNIEGIAAIKAEPECMFPYCKGGAILAQHQKENIDKCGNDCVQVILAEFKESTLGGNLIANQSEKCTKIKQLDHTSYGDAPPLTTEPPPGTGPATTLPAESSYPPSGGGSTSGESSYPPSGGGSTSGESSYPPSGGGSTSGESSYPPSGGGSTSGESSYPPSGGGSTSGESSYPAETLPTDTGGGGNQQAAETTAPPAVTSDSSPDALNLGAIIGGVLAGVLLIGIIAILIWYFAT